MVRSRRSRAASACAILVFATVAALPLPALASLEDELEAAQQRADRAAEDLAEAEEETARADDAVASVEGRVARIDGRVTLVREQVRQLAVRLYVEGTAPLTRLLRIGDANQIVRAQQFSQVIAGTSTDSLRQYRADRDDLRVELAALERKQESRAAALENLRRRQADAVEEIERLSQLAERARAAREEQARVEARASTGSEAPSSEPGPQASPAPAADSPPDAPSPSPPASTSRPAASPSPAPAAAPSRAASGGWVCPVRGPHAFSNDYGAPRGGGSSHQGNDILAARGTPVVASVDGVVTQRNGAVSGLAYFLAGDDGNRYFGAHLDSFGASGRVSAGTVIGTVGNTGDASGGPPHLHFEIHPGGTGNVNPYATLRKYC